VGTAASEVSRFESGNPDVLRRWFSDSGETARARRYARYIGLTFEELHDLLNQVQGTEPDEAPWHPCFPRIDSNRIRVLPPVKFKGRDAPERPDDMSWPALFSALRDWGVSKLIVVGNPGSGRSWMARCLQRALPRLDVRVGGEDEDGPCLVIEPWGTEQLESLAHQLSEADTACSDARSGLALAIAELSDLGIWPGPDLAIRLLASVREGPRRVYERLADILFSRLDGLSDLDARFLTFLWAELRRSRGGIDWCVLDRDELVAAVTAAGQRWVGTPPPPVLDALDELSDAALRARLKSLRRSRAARDPEAIVRALIKCGHLVPLDDRWLQPGDWPAAAMLSAMGLVELIPDVAADPDLRWALDASWWPVLRYATACRATVQPWPAAWQRLPPELAAPGAVALAHVFAGVRPGGVGADSSVIAEVQAVAALSVPRLIDEASFLGLLSHSPVQETLLQLSHRHREHLPILKGPLEDALLARAPKRMRAGLSNIDTRGLRARVAWQAPPLTIRSPPSDFHRCDSIPPDEAVLVYWAKRGDPDCRALLSGPPGDEYGRWHQLPVDVQLAWLGQVDPETRVPRALKVLARDMGGEVAQAEALLERLAELPPAPAREGLTLGWRHSIQCGWAQRMWFLRAAVVTRHTKLVSMVRNKQPEDASDPGAALVKQAGEHTAEALVRRGLANPVSAALNAMDVDIAADRALHILGTPAPLRSRLDPRFDTPSVLSSARIRQLSLAQPPEGLTLSSFLRLLPPADVLEETVVRVREATISRLIAHGFDPRRAPNVVAADFPDLMKEPWKYRWLKPGWLGSLFAEAKSVDELQRSQCSQRLSPGLLLLRAIASRYGVWDELPDTVQRWVDKLADTEKLSRAFDELVQPLQRQRALEATLECADLSALSAPESDPHHRERRKQLSAWMTEAPERLEWAWRAETPDWVSELARSIASRQDNPPHWARRRSSVAPLLVRLPPGAAAARLLEHHHGGDRHLHRDDIAVIQRWWPDPGAPPSLCTDHIHDPDVPRICDLLPVFAAAAETWRPWIRGLLSALWRLPLVEESAGELLEDLPPVLEFSEPIGDVVKLALDHLPSGELLEIWQRPDPTIALPSPPDGLHAFLDPVARTAPMTSAEARLLWLYRVGSSVSVRLPTGLSTSPLIAAAARESRHSRRRWTESDRAWAKSQLRTWRDDGRPGDDPTLRLWGVWAWAEPRAAWEWGMQVNAEEPHRSRMLIDALANHIALLRHAVPEAALWLWRERVKAQPADRDRPFDPTLSELETWS